MTPIKLTLLRIKKKTFNLANFLILLQIFCKIIHFAIISLNQQKKKDLKKILFCYLALKMSLYATHSQMALLFKVCISKLITVEKYIISSVNFNIIHIYKYCPEDVSFLNFLYFDFYIN